MISNISTHFASMRKKLYSSLYSDTPTARIYNILMVIMIFLSMIPLAFKDSSTLFKYIDYITVIVFIFDYGCRWIVADLVSSTTHSFIKYPFTFMAIIDLLTILPSLTVMNRGFKALRCFRLIKSFKAFRAFKFFRYSNNVRILVSVFKKSKGPLITVCSLAIGYVLISALIIFNVEPNTFDNFFEAVYWATVSLTTMGYGDIYPVTTAGRIVTMFSSFVGIAIVALPAGIITAGYMECINDEDE